MKDTTVRPPLPGLASAPWRWRCSADPPARPRRIFSRTPMYLCQSPCFKWVPGVFHDYVSITTPVVFALKNYYAWCFVEVLTANGFF
jgi:hypothetical protein